MNTPRIILKRASEYVRTFTPSLTIESWYIKEFTQTEILKFTTKLDSKYQALFYQATLDGLQQLQEKLTTDEVHSEAALDNVESEILKMNRLLDEHNHQSVNNSPAISSLGKIPISKQKTLVEKQQLAHEYIQFLSGVNRNNELIMSQKEYRNLLEYTSYLIQFEKVPVGVERIKPTMISKAHIKYTYYLIHKNLYGTNPIKDVFIHFLSAVFLDFEKTPAFKSLKANFSHKPDSYDKDVKKSKNEISEMT